MGRLCEVVVELIARQRAGDEIALTDVGAEASNEAEGLGGLDAFRDDREIERLAELHGGADDRLRAAVRLERERRTTCRS